MANSSFSNNIKRTFCCLFIFTCLINAFAERQRAACSWADVENQSQHFKYQYDTFDHSPCLNWLPHMKYRKRKYFTDDWIWATLCKMQKFHSQGHFIRYTLCWTLFSLLNSFNLWWQRFNKATLTWQVASDLAANPSKGACTGLRSGDNESK